MALTLVEALLQRTELSQDGARLDPANPLAQRFQAAYLPAVSGDNLGFGAQGAMPSHAQTRTATAAGPSVLFASTVQAGRSFGPTPTYPMTFVVVARQTSTANASLVELAGASGLISGASFRIGGGSSTTINLTARANFSSTATATATVPADANGNQAVNQVLVIVGQSRSATDHRVCVNGSAVATSTTSIGTLPAWDRLLFGTASGNANVSAALFGFGGAPLSDADMQRLSRSPSEVWALFEPQRIWVPMKAAGGVNGTAAGVTLTGTSSLIAGAATGQINATAAGQTLTAASSLIAGAATGQINATAAGQTLVAASSLVAGSATGQVNAAAAGQTLTATSSLVAGSAAGQINATAAGVTLSATASLIPGSASAANAGTAAGATLTATASLVPGAATGERNATAAGVTLTATSSLQAEAATGQTSATAAGVVLVAGTTIVAGTTSAANDATAAGVVIQAAATFIAGAATGPSGATAAGVVISLQAVMLRGSAYGPNLSATPGFTAVGRLRRFTATRDKPNFEAAIGADGRNLPRRRA